MTSNGFCATRTLRCMLFVLSCFAGHANAEVPETPAQPGGYNYTPDHPLDRFPDLEVIQPVLGSSADLTLPEGALVAAAPLGMRFFIQDGSSCVRPKILVKLSYPRLVYELMEPSRLRKKVHPVSYTLRGDVCRQSLSAPWTAEFTVNSKGKFIASFSVTMSLTQTLFDNIRVNYDAIDNSVVPYIDEYWKTGSVPDYVTQIKEQLLSENTAESNFAMALRERPELEQQMNDFTEPFITNAIHLAHPRAAYSVANAMINEFDVRRAVYVGTRLKMSFADREKLRLLVAKARAAEYVPSLVQVSMLRSVNIDIDEALAIVRAVGPTATVDDLRNVAVDIAPSWAQVRDALRRYQQAEACAMSDVISKGSVVSNAGEAIMLFGGTFESDGRGCKVRNSAFNTAISMGISSVETLLCNGENNVYSCSFVFYFDCGMSATGGIDLGPLNPCAALSALPIPARAVLSRQTSRKWTITEFAAP